jgi:hypothetical protein
MTMTGGSFPLRRDVGSGAFAIVSVAAASIAGQVATTQHCRLVRRLRQAFFQSAELGSRAWTALYPLMTFAFWRILRQPPSAAHPCDCAVFRAAFAQRVLVVPGTAGGLGGLRRRAQCIGSGAEWVTPNARYSCVCAHALIVARIGMHSPRTDHAGHMPAVSVILIRRPARKRQHGADQPQRAAEQHVL